MPENLLKTRGQLAGIVFIADRRLRWSQNVSAFLL